MHSARSHPLRLLSTSALLPYPPPPPTPHSAVSPLPSACNPSSWPLLLRVATPTAWSTLSVTSLHRSAQHTLPCNHASLPNLSMATMCTWVQGPTRSNVHRQVLELRELRQQGQGQGAATHPVEKL